MKLPVPPYMKPGDVEALDKAGELSHITRNLRPMVVDINTLLVDPENVRIHPEDNVEATGKSLDRYLQRQTVVVNVNEEVFMRACRIADVEPVGLLGVVQAGNSRTEILRSKGLRWVAAVFVNDDLATHTGYAIVDNRTAEMAVWDAPALLKQIDSLDWQPAGFSEDYYDELKQLVFAQNHGDGPPGGEDPGPQEPSENPVSVLGEVYELGPHRLMCGDSTESADVTLLMNGELARLIATDPPYLVNYSGGNHPDSESNKGENKERHWDDYIEHDAGVEFYEAFMRLALEHAVERIPVYQWYAAWRHPLVAEAWEKNGLLLHQQIIWVKARGVLTRSHFMWQHEPCVYGWVQGKLPKRRPPNNETTVWHIDQKGNSDRIHPTQKPLEIFARPIRWHLLPGELCYEPFGGSGSCIIAAASEGRRCNAMEMSPAFCDAIRKRWGAYAKSAGIEPGTGAL